MTLLDAATTAGLSADYVLFDSWFANPAQIIDIKSKGMDVIAMVKKSSRIKYEYCGEQLNIKEIYSRNKKRRGRSKYLLSIDVKIGKENPIPAKIVCVRNKANRKDWLAFVCTDTDLSEEEIITRTSPQITAKINFSQKDVADRPEISPSIVSGYETGERTPSTENLLALSYLYNCSTDFLLGKKESVPASIIWTRQGRATVIIYP